MQDDTASPDASPVALVGAGAMGTVLARRLEQCGVPVRAVLSRTAASAQALAERVGAAVGTDDLSALPGDVRLVLICVPDDAIAGVVEALAARAHPWARTVVAHTSGVATADVLGPLAEQGATPLSLHPLQTVTPETPPAAMEGVAMGVEGPPEAVTVGTELARTLGARPVPLTAAEKARYHCAAALASNGFVALMGVVEELLADVDLDGERAATLMAPLVEQTWANLTSAPPESVLTGPVARGDRDTVAAHLEALSDDAPHLLPLYAALSTEMARLAVRGGQVTAAEADDVLNLLQKRISGPSDDANARGPSR